MDHREKLKTLLHDACMINAIKEFDSFPPDDEIRKMREFSPVFRERMKEIMMECFHINREAASRMIDDEN